jgi:hypothetical protein
MINTFPCPLAFYAFEFPLFYNHCHHESDVTIIPSTMGTHQSDPLERALFALAHFKALRCTTSHFSSYLFPSIANDIHIIGPISIVSSTYEHSQIELCATCLFIQPLKCVTWSPFGLSLDFNTPS